MEKPAAVFLDRDGTINVERGYVIAPEELDLLPGSAAAIRRLNDAGIPVHVITNQAGIARDLYTEEMLGRIHEQLRTLLEKEGAKLGSIYHCPHHPDGTVAKFSRECDCRKPKPGLLEAAASEHGIDLSNCVVIGDTDRDVKAGKAVRAYTFLVQTGHQQESTEADLVVRDLEDAVNLILEG